MALIDARSGFAGLKITTRYSVIIPDLYEAPAGGWPVLLLLADEGCLYSDWVRKTNVEALAEKYGFAVVMPEGLHSDYENMKRGLDWNTFVFEELPAFLRETFPFSADRIVVFGCGMGGLGAVREALRNPEKYLMGGALDTDFGIFEDDAAHNSPEWDHRMKTVYGDSFRDSDIIASNDPFALVRKAKKESLPELFLAMSENAPFSMKRFAAELQSAGINAAVSGIDIGVVSARDLALEKFLRLAREKISV